jgi:hypothetical protein
MSIYIHINRDDKCVTQARTTPIPLTCQQFDANDNMYTRTYIYIHIYTHVYIHTYK